MGSPQQGDNPSTDGAPPAQTSPQEEKKQALVRQARHTVGELLEALKKERIASPTRDSTNISKNALKAFSSSEKVTVEKFVNSGGVKSILSAMSKHPSSSAVVCTGCDTIAALTMLDNGLVVELGKSGGVRVIVAAVSAQSAGGSDDALVAALKILRNVTQTAQNRATIVEGGGVEAVVEALTGSRAARTLSHAALVLSNLAFGNGVVKSAAGERGIAAIVRGMRENGEVQAMQARGALALRNLCFASAENQRIAGEAGAVEALVKTVERYSDDREVVHQACVALGNLSNTSVPNRGRLVAAGGAGVLVRLMGMYEGSLTVHEDAVSLVRNMCVESERAREEVGGSGGVGYIVRALEKWDGKVAEKACSAIRYLCFLGENRGRVREAGGVEGLVGAVKKFAGDAGIVENALLAIGNATFENAENKKAVGRCGGVTTVIKAIENQRLCERIQEHGCRVLRNLADGHEINRRLLAENGGISMGVFAMMGYPDSASVQEQACGMLLNIVLCEDYVKRVEQADVRRLAEKAIALHGKHRGVLLQAGTLIDKLNGHDVTGSEEERESVGSRKNLVKMLTRKFSSVGSRIDH